MRLRLLILFTGLIMLNGCYFPRTLYYQYPGIYDHDIFRNRTVEAGTAQPWTFSEKYNKAAIPGNYLDDITSIRTTAFLVVRNDSLLFEQYWIDGDTSVLSNSFSMSKSFVAFLIGFAIQDGYIKNVEQRVHEFVPGFQKKGKGDVRVRDLLTMSSGIKWNERYSGLFGTTTRAYYGRNLERMINRLRQEYEPGINFRYQSINTQILALIIEKATGKTLSEYASEKLWKPIGAESDALWSLDRKDGDEKAYCCFNAKARDFARIGVFCLHNGNWKGRQLLSEEYMKKCFTPASYLNDHIGNPLAFYGYQCWTTTHENMKVDMAIGLGGQYIIMVPEKNIVIVRLGHERSQESTGFFPSELYSMISAGLDIASQNP